LPFAFILLILEGWTKDFSRDEVFYSLSLEELEIGVSGFFLAFTL
jgi:hypothetical protein